MPSTLWTRCRGDKRLRPLALDAWRVVEAQHIIATRKLVDSDDEQRLLEELIDRQKPPALREPEFEGLHYLLSTPFRYPPLRHGSRFGTRADRGIWYGAEALPSAFAEVAYYRLLFLAGTTAALQSLFVELSTFTVPLRTERAVDLTEPPFSKHEATISSKMSYTGSQALGRAMRAAGVEAFRYTSARDPERGANLGLFSPRAFARKRPSPPRTWLCVATPQEVEVSRKDFFARQVFRFRRSDFEVDGTLPSPAV